MSYSKIDSEVFKSARKGEVNPVKVSKTIGILMGALPPLETDAVTLRFFPCAQENDSHDGAFLDTPEMNQALESALWPLVAVRALGRKLTLHFIGNLHGLEGSVMNATNDIASMEGYDELLRAVERNGVPTEGRATPISEPRPEG